MPDHLVEHATSVLPENPDVVAKIARHRDEQLKQGAEVFSVEDPDADEINQRNRQALIALEKDIGPDNFLAVFGFSAEDAPDLVDPAMLAASRGQTPLSS